MKIKKDENLIQNLLNKMRKRLDDEEIKKLERIKKRVKQIKTVEELEAMEEELEEIGVLDRVKLEKLKKKRKKQLERQNQSFEERVRVDLETIRRTIEVGRAFKQKEMKRQEKELIQAIEERERKGGIKEKDKERTKEERSRSGGRGRSRDSR